MRPERASDPPPFEPSVIERLVKHLGAARVGRLIADFASDLPDRIEAIEAAARAERFEELRRTTHDLAGASSSLGLKELWRIARVIETACEENRWDAARQSADELFPPQMRALAALADVHELIGKLSGDAETGRRDDASG